MRSKSLRWIPVLQIHFGEDHVGKTFPCLGDHRGRAVETGDPGLRESPDKQLGAVSRSAAEIDAELRGRQWHAPQKIRRRSGALVLELQVLAGIPIDQGSLPPIRPASLSEGQPGSLRRSDKPPVDDRQPGAAGARPGIDRSRKGSGSRRRIRPVDSRARAVRP